VDAGKQITVKKGINMIEQKRKALWSFFGLSMLTALLIGGISIYGRTTSSAGAINSTASAAAQPAVRRPWTAVASTGVVDESALDFFAFDGPFAGYDFGIEIDPIVLRYNVTNTFDNNASPEMPGWDTLEFGSFAPAGAFVRATLYRVRPCDGFQQVICTVINQGNGNRCDPCKADALGPIDFGNSLYYVEVMMRRGNHALQPRAHTLRLY
jgi:hypothetical protein